MFRRDRRSCEEPCNSVEWKEKVVVCGKRKNETKFSRRWPDVRNRKFSLKREWRPTVQRETVVVVFHFAMRPKFLKSAVLMAGHMEWRKWELGFFFYFWYLCVHLITNEKKKVVIKMHAFIQAVYFLSFVLFYFISFTTDAKGRKISWILSQ